jgi:glycosyltransferase involved in cell wall biosynthesis
MKVSVIIPTYNRIAFLRCALESVKAQTFEDYECLIANDHLPTRNDLENLLQREGFDDRFRLIQNPKQLGVSASRNRTMDLARGEILAFLDDDDIWFPNYLQKIVDSHNESPKVGLVYTGYIEFWEGDILREKTVPAKIPSVPPKEAMLAGNFSIASGSTVSIKKSCLEKSGNFDVSMASWEDWDLWLRIAHHYEFRGIREPLVRYRQHLGLRGSSHLGKKLEGIKIVMRKWGNHPEFVSLHKRYLLGAYFLEVRNKLLRGERRFKVLSPFKKMVRNFTFNNPGQLKLIGIATCLLLFGPKFYQNLLRNK